MSEHIEQTIPAVEGMTSSDFEDFGRSHHLAFQYKQHH